MNILPISKENSSKISNMSFVCACLVVSIHILPHPTSGIAGLFDKMLAGGVSRVAVPAFFCISGYLLAANVSLGNYRMEVLKRIRTLVLPFFIWNLLTLLSSLPIVIFTDIRLQQTIGSSFCKDRTIKEILIGLLGLDFTKMPFSGPLWYLRNLIFLTLLSFLIFRLIKKWHWWLVAALFFMLCVWNCIEPRLPESINGFLHYGFSLTGITAFSLGMLLRLENIHLGSKKMAWLMLCVGIILWALPTFHLNFSELKPIMTVCLGYTMWYFMPNNSMPNILVKSSFPIYLLHLIFLNYLQSFPKYILGPNYLVGFLIHWIVPISLSIVMSFILHRYFPQFSSVIFGRR